MNQNRILLVEDDRITAHLTKRILEREGYQIEQAFNAQNAIAAIFNFSDIALILMDIDLGDEIDGMAVAKQILEVKNIPIIFLSNHDEKEYVEKAEQISPYGYVVKNSPPSILFASIRMAFRLWNERSFRNQTGNISLSNQHLQNILEIGGLDILASDSEAIEVLLR
jgi:DNA-binding response OmpR family regulator